MKKILLILVDSGIQKLTGGNYTIDNLLSAIEKLTSWTITVGISLAGLALIVGFVTYAVVDVDQKPRVKQRIIQTLLGIAGIIVGLSLVNLVIDLFVV